MQGAMDDRQWQRAIDEGWVDRLDMESTGRRVDCISLEGMRSTQAAPAPAVPTPHAWTRERPPAPASRTCNGPPSPPR